MKGLASDTASARAEHRPAACGAPVRTAPGTASRWLPLPREHGAWGMLLQPFAAALILSWRWNAMVPVAFCALLLAFILREPLILLARQRWQWRTERQESAIARRALLWEAPALAGCAALLWSALPRLPLVGMGGLAAVMTAVSVWSAVRNLQRSLLLQLIASICLNGTALLAALAATGSLPSWVWPLWGLLSLHSAATIFVVRARLALKAGGGTSRAAWWFQAAQIPSAVALAFVYGWAAALPPFTTALVNGIELFRLRDPARLAEPLRRVGFRSLGIALAHTALIVVVLWPARG